MVHATKVVEHSTFGFPTIQWDGALNDSNYKSSSGDEPPESFDESSCRKRDDNSDFTSSFNETTGPRKRMRPP